MKYSVIIPIYNAQSTLRRCLDSLLSQLNDDIEVLLINDGSKDASGKICKEYVGNNKSFRYFEQENAGVSVARNVGIDNAKGDYILFVDSDDALAESAIQIIDSKLLIHDYDFIISAITINDNGNKRKESLSLFESNDPEVYFPKLSDMICRKQINAPLGKVYKRNILNTHCVRFPEGCSIAEDRAFNISYSLYISSLLVIPESFYNYAAVNQDSLSRTIRSTEELGVHFNIEREYIDDAVKSSCLDGKYLNKIREADNFCVCRQVYSRAKRMKIRGEDKKSILSGIKTDCKDVNAKRMRYPKTFFCAKIYLPVKFKQYWLIYKVAMKLAEAS